MPSTHSICFGHSLRIVLMMFLLLAPASFAGAQKDRRQLPRENVIDVPAIGEGLCVSNVFQTNMVIQRDKPLVIWGWATAGERVKVTFAGNQQSTVADADRSWRVSLPALPANSTPQTLTIESGQQTLTLDNILVGDVWVLGGQSNMEFPLERVENGQLEIVSANFPNIRILTVPVANGPDQEAGFPRLFEWSDWFGRHFRKGDWDECSPEIARELSAIGYVFARRIHMASQVPIGVIDVSRGGTTVETWTPNAVLRTIEADVVAAHLGEWDQRVAQWDPQQDLQKRIQQFQQRVERFKKEGRELPANETVPDDLRPGPAKDHNRPGNCFAGMMHPLAGLSVKGVIFHQGYNNCFNGTPGAKLYRAIFPEMIQSWREAFADPELPFGIISLCTEGPAQTLDNYCEMMSNAGPFIREAQYQTYLDLVAAGDQQVGFVSTYDLRRRWYHPQLKVPAGERAARWALATQYGFERSIKWQPPRIVEQKVEADSIELHFDQPVSAVDDGSPIAGFAIAGEDRRFQPCSANYLEIGKDDRGRPRLDKKVLVLRSPLVSQPLHFRYAWGRSPLGNVQVNGNTDIPLATQRSDAWSLENTPLGVFETEVDGKLDRRQNGQLKKALREMDQLRKQSGGQLPPGQH